MNIVLKFCYFYTELSFNLYLSWFGLSLLFPYYFPFCLYLWVVWSVLLIFWDLIERWIVNLSIWILLLIWIVLGLSILIFSVSAFYRVSITIVLMSSSRSDPTSLFIFPCFILIFLIVGSFTRKEAGRSCSDQGEVSWQNSGMNIIYHQEPSDKKAHGAVKN